MTVRLFTYILRQDGGFAPNPFWGYCTLACCKPVIRRTAEVGDLIIGIAPKQRGHRLAYAMEVAEIITFADYWRDPRFRVKRPRWRSPTILERCGDNCYEPVSGGEFHQLPSAHSNSDGSENVGSKQRDLSGKRVLVAARFWYFGGDAVALPQKLSFGIVGRGHRRQFTPEQVKAFRTFLSGLPAGVQGPPAKWKVGDRSYLQATGEPRQRHC